MEIDNNYYNSESQAGCSEISETQKQYHQQQQQ